MKTIIIGGVAGGATAATRLRRLNEKAEIIILERGGFVSFANCGLPYYIGGTITEKEKLTVETPKGFRDKFNIDVRVENEVISIDPERKILKVNELATGREYEESYDELLLSPGAEPVRPPLEGIDRENVFTLRNIPDTMRMDTFIKMNNPATAVVVGGGNIGVEMAENLTEKGIKVTIVEMADHLIAPLDPDMASDVHNYIRAKGIRLYLGSGVTAIGEGKVLTDKEEIPADMVLMSVGTKPETALAQSCGVEVNTKGSIIVDERMHTSVPHIYAVGDAVEVEHFVTEEPTSIQLAGPANKQGRIAADNIAGYDSIYTGSQGSAILKVFDMTVASTGLSEKQAKSAGIDYDKVYTFLAPHASYYPGGTNMSMKVIWDKKTEKIIGAQIVGYEGVDKRMDVLATAMRFGAKDTDLTKLELCYAPPFGSAKDPVNIAGYAAENIISGKVKQYFWDDVADLPRDGSVSLIDIRTPEEVAGGMIDGYVNIPWVEIRKRLDEIPKDKPVYLSCTSGLKSYNVSRILTGLGYDCYNLAGGYRLYSSIMKDK